MFVIFSDNEIVSSRYMPSVVAALIVYGILFPLEYKYWKKRIYLFDDSKQFITDSDNYDEAHLNYKSDSALQTFEVVTFDEKEEKLRKETREIDTIKFSPEKFADNGTYYAIVTVKEGKRLRTYCTKDELKKQIESTKAKKKFCQKCGTELLQDGSFCHKCGSVMGQLSDQCNNKYQKYETCIFNAESKTLSKENIEIDIIKFPPEKFADNGTYYAIRTIKDGKKVRIYYPKSVWDKKIESHL